MEEPEVTEIKKNSDNKEYVKEAVRKNGKLLEFASSKLQDDEEIVKIALQNTGEALEFASNRLKDNKEIALLAIQKKMDKCYTLLVKDYEMMMMW